MNKYKIHWQCFKANWNNFKCYPRIWRNTANNPNFKYNGITIRFLWWY